jgi:hypothetical protein
MDKNIAALLREDTKTVHVSFDLTVNDFEDLSDMPASKPAGAPRGTSTGARGPRLYSYVTHLDVVPGDTVIVRAAGDIKLAAVIRVDAEVEIEPNSSTRYEWVIDTVDFRSYEANASRNVEIERTVSEAYRNNMRRSFAQTILAGVDEERRAGLQALLSGGGK